MIYKPKCASAKAYIAQISQRFQKLIYLHLFTDCLIIYEDFSSIVGMNTVPEHICVISWKFTVIIFNMM